MARGERTSEALELQFREKYLEIGVVKRATEAVGIPVRTGYELAERAEADPEFARARDYIRSRVGPEVEKTLLEFVEAVRPRVLEPDPTPQELAKIAVDNDLKSFHWQNPKPAYIQALVAFYKTLAGLAKTEQTPQAGPAVVINLTGEAEVTEAKQEPPRDGS